MCRIRYYSAIQRSKFHALGAVYEAVERAQRAPPPQVPMFTKVFVDARLIEGRASVI